MTRIFWPGHLKPQHRFTGGKLSKVFNYENGLANVIAEVFNDLGLKLNGSVNIPVVNKSDEMPVKLEDRDIALIEKVYAEDFVKFNYQIDRSKLEVEWMTAPATAVQPNSGSQIVFLHIGKNAGTQITFLAEQLKIRHSHPKGATLHQTESHKSQPSILLLHKRSHYAVQIRILFT